LSNPDRLVIEIRTRGTAKAPDAVLPAPPAALPPPEPDAHREFVPPPQPLPIIRRPDPLPPAPLVESGSLAGAGLSLPPVRTPDPPRSSRPRTLPEFRDSSASRPKPATPRETADPPARDTSSRPAPSRELIPRAATKNSDGQRSMTRVLGLKIGRIVIDPGHGGHDTGTSGRNGLLEKELVLDVSRRLGKLITERMGSEVIFTRSDDTFIPLETRTAIANDKRADLFLSIHANSSTIRTIAGVETFYLNFSASKSDLDVAARENASSSKTVYELKDLLQKIALQDKVEESREFAARVQSSLHNLASRNLARQRNRGVKKAPFVVLIGAQMPSILAEIGFVSNPREEALMNRPEHRQKIAEALYKGLAQYAGTLSHFQLAQSSGE
ncbi:MAG: N-acetylmuramoyl-L-alanine amidase, partial [Acidobacteria bacterium]|nr:N-acetylmuramoyl-L-alanine amidase [Acidobacteriota bacterium]